MEMKFGRMTIAACVLLACSPPAISQADMGFDVNVTLSKKAAAKLASQKEGIVAFADYYGDPKRSAEKHANEIGQISLAPQDEEVAIPGTGGRAASAAQRSTRSVSTGLPGQSRSTSTWHRRARAARTIFSAAILLTARSPRSRRNLWRFIAH
jgi:hypothetical protein